MDARSVSTNGKYRLIQICFKVLTYKLSYKSYMMDSSDDDNQYFRKAIHAESYTQVHGHSMHMNTSEFCIKELCSREALHTVKSAEEVSGMAIP